MAQQPTQANNFTTGAPGENAPGFRGADYYHNLNKSFPTAPVAPVTPPSQGGPITAASMAPVTPVKLPDATTPTYGGVQGAVESLVNQTKTADQLALEQAKANSDNSMNAYIKALTESGDISSSVDRTAQDIAKQKSDAYTSQIEQEQLAARRQIEDITRNNPTGALRGGQADLITNIQRDSLQKQADLAILQTAANRQYDTAAAIADRQVALKLEKSNAQLAGLKFFYENNKADFNKADDRLYSEMIKAKDREIKKQTDTEEQIKQLKLNVAQYGGGANILSQLSAIDTTKPDAFDKAVKIAGKYASDPLDRQIKEAQLGKLKNESGLGNGIVGKKLDDTEYSKFVQTPSYKAINDGSKYQTALAAMKKAIDDYGTREVLSAKGAGELNSAYQSLTAATKDYYNLGTLDSGVEKLIALGIPKPDSFTIRDRKVKSSIDAASAQANTNINSAVNQLKSSVYGNSLDFMTLISNSNLGQQIPLTDEEKIKAQNDYFNTAKASLVNTALKSTGLHL